MRKAPLLFPLLLFTFFIPTQFWAQNYNSLPMPFLDNQGYCRGISWVDVDNDDDLDVYISGQITATEQLNTLYINNGDGTYTLSPELQPPAASMGHGWGDYNNDGNIDVLIARTWNFGELNQFYINNGGTFTLDNSTGLTPAIASPYEGTVSWGDYDNDGDLDVYIVRWNDQTNQLFRNNGNSTFTQMGLGTGPVISDTGWSSTGTWGDFDNDLDLDLFVTNYQIGSNPGVNILYENNGDGSFSVLNGAGSITTDAQNSRDANWIDYNNDGFFDIFVANQNGQDRLYQNNGDNTFTDVTSIGPFASGSSWTSNWGDYDNDGDLDLFSIGLSGSSDSRFLRNDGGSFTQVNPDNMVPTNFSGSISTSALFTDHNNDGWLDIHITYPGNGGTDYFFEAEPVDCNTWIEIDLTGITSNRDGIGAKIAALAEINGNQVWQYRHVTAQNSKSAHNMQRTHFGFDEAPIIDSLIIYWPSGTVCTFDDVDVNQIIDIDENCIITNIVDAPSTVGQNEMANVCTSEPDTTLFSDYTGGTISSNCGNCIDINTGLFSPGTVGPGTYEAYYTVIGPCGFVDTVTLQVLDQVNTTINNEINGVDITQLCENTPVQMLEVETGGGLWASDCGNCLDDTGTFDPTIAGPGLFTISYSIEASCGDTSLLEIEVFEAPDAGEDGVVDACSDDATIDLFTVINNADSGGDWFNPNGTSTSNILDPSSGTSGTYSYIIQGSGTCANDTAMVEVTLSTSADATITPVGPYCEGDMIEVLIAANTGGTWSGSGVDENTGSFDPSIAGVGTWDIMYSIAGTCGDDDVIQIEVNASPTVDAGIDTTITLGESVMLEGSGSGTTLLWSPDFGLSCTDCENPVAAPVITTVYTLVSTSDNGCVSSDQVVVNVDIPVIEQITYYVPNVFSPNDDGINDNFTVLGDVLQDFELTIYNRWGGQVYETKDQIKGWDGKMNGDRVNPDVYVYMFQYTDAVGRTITESGDVTVIK